MNTNWHKEEMAGELAGLVIGQGYEPRTLSVSDGHAIAGAILSAGYRRPRQVSSVEELDALRKNAVIMQPGGTVLVHDGQVEDPWASYAEDPYGGPIWTSSAHVTLPVTVLHEGTL